MLYKNYLNTDHWKKVRTRMYKGNPRCKLCKRKIFLNIHHRTYDRFGHEKNSDLIILCKFCHTAIHKDEKLRKQLQGWYPKTERDTYFL
jgi:phage terminase large subunit GpA-like protein